MSVRIRGHRFDGEEIVEVLFKVAVAVFLVAVIVGIALTGVLAATGLVKAILGVIASMP